MFIFIIDSSFYYIFFYYFIIEMYPRFQKIHIHKIQNIKLKTFI
jgi:hypothetical protein